MCVLRGILKLISILAFCLFLTEIASCEEKQNSSPADKFHEIGDLSIIKESSALISEAEKLVKDITEKPISRDRSLDFNNIRPVRSKLSKRSLELRGVLENFRQYKSVLSARVVPAAKIEEPDGDPGDLIEQNKSLINQIREEEDRLRSKLVQETDANLKRQIESDIRRIEARAETLAGRMPQLEKRKETARITVLNEERELNDIKTSIGQIDTILDEGKTQLRKLDETLVTMDDLSATLLQTDILNINYTDRSTYIFGVLVAAVIVGFFVIAFMSEDVRKAIFTGDSGIQFVTLFSLVIAIILFGVLKILEGKELAALLGGLSGYILGRGSGRPSQSGQPQLPQGPSGPAPTPTVGSSPTFTPTPGPTPTPAPVGGGAAGVVGS